MSDVEELVERAVQAIAPDEFSSAVLEILSVELNGLAWSEMPDSRSVRDVSPDVVAHSVSYSAPLMYGISIFMDAGQLMKRDRVSWSARIASAPDASPMFHYSGGLDFCASQAMRWWNDAFSPSVERMEFDVQIERIGVRTGDVLLLSIPREDLLAAGHHAGVLAQTMTGTLKQACSRAGHAVEVVPAAGGVRVIRLEPAGRYVAMVPGGVPPDQLKMLKDVLEKGSERCVSVVSGATVEREGDVGGDDS